MKDQQSKYSFINLKYKETRQKKKATIEIHYQAGLEQGHGNRSSCHGGHRDRGRERDLRFERERKK